MSELLAGIAKNAANLSALVVCVFMLFLFLKGQVVSREVVISLTADVIAEIDNRNKELRSAERKLHMGEIKAIVIGAEERIKRHVTTVAEKRGDA